MISVFDFSRMINELPGALGTVLGPTLSPVFDAGRVQSTSNNVILYARKVLDPATPDQHDRVLLEIVPLTRDVGRDFDSVREADASDLPERRVRLLWRGRVNARANAAALRATTKSRSLGLLDLAATPFAY